MTIKLRRVYEKPEKADGARMLWTGFGRAATRSITKRSS